MSQSIKLSKKEPTEEGRYIAFFKFSGPEVIYIVWNAEHTDLVNVGRSTHFSRWDCLWSEKLTFEHNEY